MLWPKGPSPRNLRQLLAGTGMSPAALRDLSRSKGEQGVGVFALSNKLTQLARAAAAPQAWQCLPLITQQLCFHWGNESQRENKQADVGVRLAAEPGRAPLLPV